ncbi:tumor necrosis factor receptor superfamily member 6 [Hypomesus transpacificus]|uniref:tumor necrosis factor receptor superfamily member 6 n=1 Tax=Hypomesus transpacificus TaxID=137520 RepID=UPI001F0828F0|nr:tumor necrosis factor receptor superfamily member 6 [Hypomesus transpacificus]
MKAMLAKMVTLLVFMCVVMSVTLKAEESSKRNLSLLRFKRQDCPDGTYEHEGVTCCRCAPGQRLQKHCTLKPDDRICDFCTTEVTYNSEPTFLDSCEPCSSCDPKANLEVEDKCTIRKNTVCRCQKGYYCDRAKEDCTACHLCKTCGENVVKVPCTATNNTICHEGQKDSDSENNYGRRMAIAVTSTLVFIAAAAGLGVFCWRKKKACFAPKVKPTDSGTGQKIPLLRGVILTPHIPDITTVVGWKNMRDVAMRCGMSPTEIESHQLNSPDSNEWCQGLLNAWVEKEGSQAAEKLVLNLRQIKKKTTAERVEAILGTMDENGHNREGKEQVEKA